MKKPFTLSIIFPVFNEEANIEQTIVDATDWLSKESGVAAYEIIAVNDGSTDGTADVLKRLKKEAAHLIVVDYPENKGYGGALMSGIGIARYDWILLMDSDGQFKLESLRAMLAFGDDYDIVAGYRAQRRDNVVRVWMGEVYTFLAGTFLKVKLRDINCGFKLFRKRFLDVAGINTHAGAFYTHVFMNAHAKGARIKEVPISHYPRRNGHPTGASPKVVMMAINDFVQLVFHKKSG